jgi:hypothetical protein
MLAVMAVIAAIGIGFAALSGSSTSRPTLERARPPARLPAQPVPAAPVAP